MKRKESVWKSKLTEQDWYFQPVSDGNVSECHRWEFEREKWQLENGGAWPVNLNRKFQELPTSEELRRQRFDDPAPRPRFWHPHPHFPQIPFLKLTPAKAVNYGGESPYSMIGRDWIGFVRYYRHKLKSIINLDDHTSDPFYDDKTGDDEAIFHIPWSMSDAWLVKEFRKWLKEKRPPGGPKRFKMDYGHREKPKRGRGSELLKLRADLKALAAARLLSRYGHWQIALQSDCRCAKYLGNNFINRQSAWSEAKKRVQKVIENLAD